MAKIYLLWEWIYFPPAICQGGEGVWWSMIVLMSPFDYYYSMTLCQWIRCIFIVLLNVIHIILYEKSQGHIVWQSKMWYCMTNYKVILYDKAKWHIVWHNTRSTLIKVAHPAWLWTRSLKVQGSNTARCFSLDYKIHTSLRIECCLW